MARAFSSKIDLADSVRKKTIKLLNDNLVDAIHFTIHAKQAHWNVKGSHFYQLHLLFDKIYEESAEWSDLLAERIAQLGGLVEANLECVGKRSRLPSYGIKITEGFKHVEALSSSLAMFCRTVRKAIDESAKAGDAGTADLFTEISRKADQYLWFLESHLVKS